MQASTKMINSANATIHAVFDKASIARAEDAVARDIAKDAKLDGFRKGKTPTALIKARFREKMTSDVRSLLAREALDEAVSKLNNPQLIGMPVIAALNEKEDALEMDVKLSLRPAIELGDYMRLVPTHEPFSVSEQELNETLQRAADSTAVAADIADDRPLAKEDIAVFDFDGFLDGKPIEKASGRDYELQIGSNVFVPGFEDRMIGLKKGEKRAFNVTFPADYPAQELSGADVRFEVALKGIKVKKSVEITDEIAQKLLPNIEGADVAKLRGAVERSLLNDQKRKLYDEKLRAELLGLLSENYAFDLPESIVEQEIDHLATSKARDISEEELRALSGDEKRLKEFRESVRKEAEERVKVTLIIDALAKAENISVNDQEVAQAIYYEALKTGQNPKEMFEYYKKNSLIAVVRMSLTEDRVLTTLLEKKNGGREAK
ncbi:MAG: trigger factor [Helicobacteraceae bacterium]|jgi:trigger factor|nr:trigger factor [Helicobacteraceae bacterium]